MSQLRPQIFSRITPRHLLTVLGIPLLAYIFALLPSNSVAAASDCSDVFTPLSSYVTDGVAANKHFYIQAMNETGVPWEMLAAIHYRETNFSHTNPSNGQGIFQFVNGDGGPYPAGPVSDDNFYKQLKFMANKLQSDYVWRGSVPRERRQLIPNEQNMAIVKDTLFSYNGRASAYANQAASYGYNSTTQPYEGSPYVMNRFDCPRARMGIITKDYATGIDSQDTRYGAFTVFARLRGDSFWLLMTRAFSWNLVAQEAYFDPSRTKPADTMVMAPNQTIYLRIKARNIGSSTWNQGGSNPVHLATTSPKNRSSNFCDTSWLYCHRPSVLKEDSVSPGNVGTFEFSITAGQYENTQEYFSLVSEGKEWFNDFGLHWPIRVLSPTPLWQSISQDIHTDINRTKLANPQALSPNTTYHATVRARNTGNTIWQKDGAHPVRLGTSSPVDRTSLFSNASWMSSSRASSLSETSVAPGDTGTFNFTFTTPSSYGSYKEYFRPVAEGQAWMNDIGFYWPLKVAAPTPLWQITSQKTYTNNTKTTATSTQATANTSRIYMVIKARNTGNTIWQKDGAHPVRLGTSSPVDRTSDFYDSSWLSPSRPATLAEVSVAPGEIGTFEFWMKAPIKANGTSLKEYFRPVAEGQAWMNDIGMYQSFTFSTSDWNWQHVEQGAYTNNTYTTSANIGSAARNTTYYLQLRLKNTSGKTWQRSSFRLGTASPNDRTSVFYHSSWLGSNRVTSLKESSVAPGATGTFTFTIQTPNTSTTSKEYFRPVIDGYGWMNDLGLYWDFNVQ